MRVIKECWRCRPSLMNFRGRHHHYEYLLLLLPFRDRSTVECTQPPPSLRERVARAGVWGGLLHIVPWHLPLLTPFNYPKTPPKLPQNSFPCTLPPTAHEIERLSEFLYQWHNPQIKLIFMDPFRFHMVTSLFRNISSTVENQKTILKFMVFGGLVVSCLLQFLSNVAS